ncbi:MAG: hypothetical protein PVJ42_01660 [bacterium]|jgi:hypothetical protein
MQAPLRKGKEGETLGRANGIKRTGRSFLLGLLLVALAAVSSLFYTWERLTVETQLDRNFELETELEMVRNQTEILAYEVAVLECAPRLENVARGKLGMDDLNWEFVYVIENREE